MDRLEFCRTVARDAGRLAHSAFGRSATSMKGRHDVLTEMDGEVERFIRAALASRFPDDAVIGEEQGGQGGERLWLIDPIDGTANFVYDLPAWCTSVAVVDEHGTVAGAVFVPVTDELFSAARGAGATRNDEPIRCSTASQLATALVGTGFAYAPTTRALQARRLAALLPQVRDIRRYGSAAIDLCMVACGRLDAYYEEHLNSWDLAAGTLIAAEAGAITTNFHGGRAGPDATVASAPGVHAALVEAIVSIDAANGI